MNFYVHRNFSKISELNNFISASSASGLIEKWRIPTNGKSSIDLKRSEERTDGLIGLEHIYGAFGIWIGMETYKICIFVIEIVVYKQARKSNQKFWIFLEGVIEPERRFLTANKWV